MTFRDYSLFNFKNIHLHSCFTEEWNKLAVFKQVIHKSKFVGVQKKRWQPLYKLFNCRGCVLKSTANDATPLGGLCRTSSECTSAGGTSDGSCAAGFKHFYNLPLHIIHGSPKKWHVLKGPIIFPTQLLVRTLLLASMSLGVQNKN